MKSVSLKPKESVITAANPAGSKQHLARYPPLPQPLISNGEAVSTSTTIDEVYPAYNSISQKGANVGGDNY